VVAVYPPNDSLPEVWLSRFDNLPTILPEWPASDKMALVCVRNTGPGPEDVEAFVIRSPEELTRMSNPDTYGLQRLFFRVLRSKLLEDPEICPGLTPESFWSSSP
jgi:hypothetical protein